MFQRQGTDQYQPSMPDMATAFNVNKSSISAAWDESCDISGDVWRTVPYVPYSWAILGGKCIINSIHTWSILFCNWSEAQNSQCFVDLHWWMLILHGVSCCSCDGGRPLWLRRMVLAIITLASPFMGLEEAPSFVWERKSQLSTILLCTSRAGGFSTEMAGLFCDSDASHFHEMPGWPERYEPHNSSSSSFLCLDQQKIRGMCRCSTWFWANADWTIHGLNRGWDQGWYTGICAYLTFDPFFDTEVG